MFVYLSETNHSELQFYRYMFICECVHSQKNPSTHQNKYSSFSLIDEILDI